MSGIKLTDILADKKPGDTWHGLQAPEELHVWQYDAQWNVAKCQKYSVSLLAFGAKASVETGESSGRKYSKSEPLELPQLGERIIRGGEKVSQLFSRSIYHRVDDFDEVNSILSAVSQKEPCMFFWNITELEIYNPKTGGIVIFKKHNPDGHGACLYAFRFNGDEFQGKLYPEINLFDQQRAIGKFKGAMARCVAANFVGHGCAIMSGVSTVIRRAKNNISKEQVVDLQA